MPWSSDTSAEEHQLTELASLSSPDNLCSSPSRGLKRTTPDEKALKHHASAQGSRRLAISSLLCPPTEACPASGTADASASDPGLGPLPHPAWSRRRNKTTTGLRCAKSGTEISHTAGILVHFCVFLCFFLCFVVFVLCVCVCFVSAAASPNI